ncbi:hypothetical protein L9F63_021805, partial [Diploptera punctata]
DKSQNYHKRQSGSFLLLNSPGDFNLPSFLRDRSCTAAGIIHTLVCSHLHYSDILCDNNLPGKVTLQRTNHEQPEGTN